MARGLGVTPPDGVRQTAAERPKLKITGPLRRSGLTCGFSALGAPAGSLLRVGLCAVVSPFFPVGQTGGAHLNLSRRSVPLDSATKTEIMTEHATVANDTGSPEVQVAMLTKRISDLTEHLKIAQARPPQPSRPAAAGRPRRRLLKYLAKKDINRYRALIEKLGLRR